MSNICTYFDSWFDTIHLEIFICLEDNLLINKTYKHRRSFKTHILVYTNTCQPKANGKKLWNK